MPMGHITQTDRTLSLVPSARVLETIRSRFNLLPIVGYHHRWSSPSL
jgi:hypothetical protein